MSHSLTIIRDEDNNIFYDLTYDVVWPELHRVFDEDLNMVLDYTPDYKPEYCEKYGKMVIERNSEPIPNNLFDRLKHFNDSMLRERMFNIGDKCVYRSAVINGTGTTTVNCIIDEVVDSENKIYKVKEDAGYCQSKNNLREYTVQDIDMKAYRSELKHIHDAYSLQWIELETEN